MGGFFALDIGEMCLAFTLSHIKFILSHIIKEWFLKV